MTNLISPIVTTTNQLATIETGALIQFSGTIAVGFFVVGLLTVVILTLVGLITVIKNSIRKPRLA